MEISLWGKMKPCRENPPMKSLLTYLSHNVGLSWSRSSDSQWEVEESKEELLYYGGNEVLKSLEIFQMDEEFWEVLNYLKEYKEVSKDVELVIWIREDEVTLSGMKKVVFVLRSIRKRTILKFPRTKGTNLIYIIFSFLELLNGASMISFSNL